MSCIFKKGNQVLNTTGVAASEQLAYCVIPVLNDYQQMTVSVSTDNIVFSEESKTT